MSEWAICLFLFPSTESSAEGYQERGGPPLLVTRILVSCGSQYIAKECGLRTDKPTPSLLKGVRKRREGLLSMPLPLCMSEVPAFVFFFGG